MQNSPSVYKENGSKQLKKQKELPPLKTDTKRW
jgi:hypothetical protein